MGGLVSQPANHIPDDVMEKVIEELKRKTRTSAEKFEAAQKVIPGGCEHLLSHKNPYPPFIETAAALHIDVNSEDGLPQIFDRHKAIRNHQTFLRNEGIMTLMGKGYVTSAHGDEEIKKTVEAYSGLIDVI